MKLFGLILITFIAFACFVVNIVAAVGSIVILDNGLQAALNVLYAMVTGIVAAWFGLDAKDEWRAWRHRRWLRKLRGDG